MTQPRLLLLSTDHCSLCEKALDLLLSMPELQGLGLDVVDVADDDALLSRFADRLPVLAVRSADNSLTDTLDWPFNPAAVSGWLRQLEQSARIAVGDVDDPADG
jgi:hypothetical protein